jgi:hypothetical protein
MPVPLMLAWNRSIYGHESANNGRPSLRIKFERQWSPILSNSAISRRYSLNHPSHWLASCERRQWLHRPYKTSDQITHCNYLESCPLNVYSAMVTLGTYALVSLAACSLVNGYTAPFKSPLNISGVTPSTSTTISILSSSMQALTFLHVRSI